MASDFMYILQRDYEYNSKQFVITFKETSNDKLNDIENDVAALNNN